MFWGMAGSFAPCWSWQPLWLEIAVQCKGTHLTVFAPYHLQRISALETMGALSCLSSSSTFYLKHIWVLVLEKQLKKLITRDIMCGVQFPPFPYLYAVPSYHVSLGTWSDPLPVDLGPKALYNSGLELLGSLFCETTISRWISHSLQATFLLFCTGQGYCHLGTIHHGFNLYFIWHGRESWQTLHQP